MRRFFPRPALLGFVAVLVALAALSGRAAAPAPALAAGILDANYQPAGPYGWSTLSGSSYAYGQTFPAGRSGRLDRAELLFERPGGPVHHPV